MGRCVWSGGHRTGAGSQAAFLQLGMQPVQTVQAAEPVAFGDMRPAVTLRRNAAAVGTPAHRPDQDDTHHCSTQTQSAVGPETPFRQAYPSVPVLFVPDGGTIAWPPPCRMSSFVAVDCYIRYSFGQLELHHLGDRVPGLAQRGQSIGEIGRAHV